MKPVVYSCVTAGYDAVAPVQADWNCDFVLFHDGTVKIPNGWRGERLSVDGFVGADLNRYAKMLPHRLGLTSDRSMYVDGNVVFKADPSARICAVLEHTSFSAYSHPTRDCPYAEIRETLRLGFIGPSAAWKQVRAFRKAGLPRKSGLFEAGVLFRQHNDPATALVGEAWWRLWQGGLRRDQPLLVEALRQTGTTAAVLGVNDIHGDSNKLLGITPHAKGRPRSARLPNRIASEIALYRLWLPK